METELVATKWVALKQGCLPFSFPPGVEVMLLDCLYFVIETENDYKSFPLGEYLGDIGDLYMWHQVNNIEIVKLWLKKKKTVTVSSKNIQNAVLKVWLIDTSAKPMSFRDC